jgi:hypothetical protein
MSEQQSGNPHPEPDWLQKVNERIIRQAEIRASGEPQTPLHERWQRELRSVLNDWNARTGGIPGREQLCFFLMAELLRWLRDELGWDVDDAAENAAGYADVFPKYGGVE